MMWWYRGRARFFFQLRSLTWGESDFPNTFWKIRSLRLGGLCWIFGVKSTNTVFINSEIFMSNLRGVYSFLVWHTQDLLLGWKLKPFWSQKKVSKLLQWSMYFKHILGFWYLKKLVCLIDLIVFIGHSELWFKISQYTLLMFKCIILSQKWGFVY